MSGNDCDGPRRAFPFTAIQYNLPEIDADLSCEGNRHQVYQHFPDPQVRKIVQIDVATINAYDDVLKVLELDIGLVMLYEIHDISRFETVQVSPLTAVW